ncbi:MAG: prepilin-type N-terminal cleavage/methylation domain-containing protein [Pseudonocardiales bacterium]
MAEPRRRLAGPRSDTGVSLVEMLVVMMLFSGIVVVTYAVLATVQNQTADTLAKSDDAAIARLGMAQIDRQVRSGNVLYSPADEVATAGCTAVTVAPSVVPNAGNCMRVYTQANGLERCVQWQTLGGRLRSRSWSPAWQTDGLVSTWQTVAYHVVNPSAIPPFVLQGSSTSYGARLVDVRLQVQSPGVRGPATQVVSSLSGRNTQYGYDPGVCSPVPAA